ncbi:MAG: sulfatase-like hydrolase/transferase [Akkermansiaceae bacterium]|nr:sulfatase-like hydrolase/transferase [Akkermansiaceae bacterium]
MLVARILAILAFPTLLFAAPNVIVIVSDDGGYADWGFMDSYLQTLDASHPATPVPTPNLDSLRARGVLCTNAYTAPVCSPSRAAIVTGGYQNRIGYEYNINNLSGANSRDGLFDSQLTIFDRMKSAGYTTGAIGKWHIGNAADDNGTGNRPEKQGVDEFFGVWGGSRNYNVGSLSGTLALRETIRSPFSDTEVETQSPWNVDLIPSSSARPDLNAYVTNCFGEGAQQFISRHYAEAQPFFLYIAYTCPHSPISASPDIDDPRLAGLSGTRKNYASMILTMDKEIGLLLDQLADPAGDGSVDITDETVIIYINDNGGANGIGADNGPLRDNKGSTYEGGIRVPMILAGPGIPVNGSYHQPVHSMDILPTCLAAAGAAVPADIEGINLLPYLNGTVTTPPHETIAIRFGSNCSLRKGDWKIVKSANGSGGFELYNLVNDISETTDLAGSEPEKLAELLHEYTEFEARNEKPRHATLGKTASTINQNDRFVLDPASPGAGTSFVADLTLVGGTTLNGDFNTTSSSGNVSYADTPSWENIGANADQDSVATRTDDAIDGSRNAVISKSTTRSFGLATAHTLGNGEVFRATYDWKDSSSWDDLSDRIRVTLFTTADNQINGTRTVIQSVDSNLSAVDGAAQSEIAQFDPIPASAVGKSLFVMVDSAESGSGFARLDNFVLERGVITASQPTANLKWSDASVWKNPENDSAVDLFVTDSFAGCVLDFPVRDDFSYLVENDRTRLSKRDFMANSLRFTGNFAGTSPQSGGLHGLPVLLTNALDGTAPSLDLAANGAGFTFEIDVDLQLHNDLVVSGDGNAQFRMTGVLADDYAPVGVTKTGASTFRLASSPTYTGPTSVTGGTLIVEQTAALNATSAVVLGIDGTLGGNGQVGANITGAGTIAPGESIGTLTAAGDVALGKLQVELDATSADQLLVSGTLDLTNGTLDLIDLGGGFTESPVVIASYGQLTGVFAAINGLPATHKIDYAFDDGSGSNHIAIVPLTAFESWMQHAGVSGPDAAFEADANGDGVSNGIAFLLGADNPGLAARSLLPTVVSDPSSGDVTLTYRANSLVNHHAEFSSDLELWTPVTSDVRITVTTTDDYYADGIDRVEVVIPAAVVDDGKLFVHVVATP